MADERNRILPTVYRTGNQIIDRNLDSIFQTFRRLIIPKPDTQSAGSDDHEVKATTTDTGHGPLSQKLKALSGISLTETETNGVKQVGIACTVSPGTDDHMVAVSSGDAPGFAAAKVTGDGVTTSASVRTVAGIGEQVVISALPAAPTPGQGSWLYTASIQADTLHEPVRAFVKSLQGMGGLDPGQAELFDVLPNGDYQHKAVGQLYGLDPSGAETFVLAQGQRVWLTTWVASSTVVHGRFCTVLTLGNGSTKAVLHPTGEEIVSGSTFKVEGVGAEFYGWYWEIDPDPTNPYPLTYKPDYINATTYNLLTSTQVSRAGSTTRETTVTIPANTSGATPFAVALFEMLDGIGTSTISKGVVNWEVAAYLVADDPAATTYLEAYLTTDQGILDRFGYGYSRAMHNTAAAVLKFQGTIPADRDVNPSDKLAAYFSVYSNTTTGVTVKLVFNSASHLTRVQTPLETASYGTLDHQLLTAESRGFGADQAAAAMRSRHPRRAIENFAMAPLAFASGNLTPHHVADAVEFDTEVTVERIDTSQFPGDFGFLFLIFVVGGHLLQKQGDSGDFAEIDMGNFEGASEEKIAQLDFGNHGSAMLYLFGGSWHLHSYNTGRKL